MKTLIKHKAFIREVTEDSLRVAIVNKSACSRCHAEKVCTMADKKVKEVEIFKTSGHYSPGEEVTVVLRESLGLKALFYGYVLPFIIVLVTLITVFSVAGDEVIAGLFSLGVLVPYYIILYFMRQYLKKVFKFGLDDIG
jgi:positive regulator of sigma E activity